MPCFRPTLHVAALLALGLLFHLLCVRSVLDIYFTSSVSRGIASHGYATTAAPAPAKRAVVFVVDGCRVDKLLRVTAASPTQLTLDVPAEHTHRPQSHNVSHVPFLGDVIRHRGSWGVSHVHTPTESRVCHVAISAGMYEDPNAVTRGWKDHPQAFDSVFNRSSRAFILGNIDVVPKLARHAPQASEQHYSRQEEVAMDRQDASLMDIWVFRRLEELLASQNATLQAELQGDGVVFYCHLLGTDMTGPRYGTDSREYLDNIAVVDELVEKMYHLVETFYGHDGKTAYVLTSDHGMDVRGVHGDDTPANIRTALVAWGAGVQGPQPASTQTEGFDIELPTHSRTEIRGRLHKQREEEQAALNDWGDLKLWRRKDVMQVDVAPLVSALLGLPYPRNSVGVLPFTYLSKCKYRAVAVQANALQLYQHALRKEQERRDSRMLRFSPYAPLSGQVPLLLRQLEEAVESVGGDGSAEEPENETAHALVEVLSQEVVAVCLSAMEYYRRYDWPLLRGSIVLGYVGWMLVVAVAFLRPLEFRVQRLLGDPVDPMMVMLILAASMLLALENAPNSYYLYVLWPPVFWSFTWRHRDVLKSTWSADNNSNSSHAAERWRAGVECVLILLGLNLVVLGYERREFFGVLLSILAFWPLTRGGATPGRAGIGVGAVLVSPSVCWSLSCLLLSAFPSLLPSEYVEDTSQVHAGALLSLVFAFTLLRQTSSVDGTRDPVTWKQLLAARAAPVLLSMATLQWTTNYLESKSVPPPLLVTANWLLALGPVAMLLRRTHFQGQLQAWSKLELQSGGTLEDPQPKQVHPTLLPVQQLTEIMLAFTPCVVLLSVAYETAFYAVLCCVLVSWLRLEVRQTEGVSVWREVRRAFLFLVLVQTAFFGTGSVASMTSFQVSSTRRFVTGSASTATHALVALKLLIPFVLVGSAFHLVLARSSSSAERSSSDPRQKLQSPSWKYFLPAVAMADVLALRFLFLVRGEGSWKQMGNSIATFAVANALLVLLPLIFVLSAAFVPITTLDSAPREGVQAVEPLGSKRA